MSDGSRTDTKAWEILDKVALASVAEQRRARRWGIFFKLLTFIYIGVFLLLIPNLDRSAALPSGKHVGLVQIEGIIHASEGVTANQVAAGLRKAFEHDNMQALILAINSPGGSPVQSSYIYQEIMRLKKLHPDVKVYAALSDIAASGGYYIAAAADEIYADRSSLVGSIGVVSESFGFTGAMEKIGVERRVFTAGESKAFLDPYSPLDEKAAESWQEVLNTTHELFKERVREGRGDRLKDFPELFSGMVWSGEQAVGYGLVDGIGSAGYIARELVGSENIVDYTVQPNPLDQLVKRFGISVGEGFARVFSNPQISGSTHPHLR